MTDIENKTATSSGSRFLLEFFLFFLRCIFHHLVFERIDIPNGNIEKDKAYKKTNPKG